MMDHTKKLYNAIYVSDRIVTYKTAAAILNLDVNESKLALKTFVENIRQKNESVGVTYVVGGTICDKHKLIIVPEHKYEKTKSLFDNITIDHIYSVQKSDVIDWAAVFNVDDLLYEDKNVEIKKEIQTETVIEIKQKEINKKGSIHNLFSQSGKDIKKESKSIKQEHDVKKEKNTNGTSKSVKSSFMSNFMSKANKENVNESNKSDKIDTKAINSVINAEDDDEEIGVKRNKKRARIINDDDDLPESKSPKIDILDDDCDVDEKSENEDSTEDIFGSPEKDPELNNEEIIKLEGSDDDLETKAPSGKGSENTQTEADTSEQMYEDDEGFFVTEKTPASKKRKLDNVPDQLKDGKIKEEMKVEKQIKKQVTQKLKKDTNQKTLFNFFTKK